MKTTAAIALPTLLLLAGCATYPDTPRAEEGPALPAGSEVALGQPVQVAGIVLTPRAVIEDSRCPMNARCVWAGRIVVETRVDGAGWRETVPMTLGEPKGVRGYILNLVAAEPNRMAGGEQPEPSSYRFAYEGWPPDRPLD